MGSIIGAFFERTSRSNFNRARLRASQKEKENEETSYSDSVDSLSIYDGEHGSDGPELNLINYEISGDEKAWSSISCNEGADKPGSSPPEVTRVLQWGTGWQTG
jgi:hypothetical protein